MRSRRLIPLIALVAVVGLGCGQAGAEPLGAASPAPSPSHQPGPAPDSSSASPVRPDQPTPTASSLPAGGPPAAAPPSQPPVRRAVDLAIIASPRRVFASEVTDVMCAPAAIQITVNILTGRPDRTVRFQRRIDRQRGALTVWRDSHNGEWGPAAEASAIERFSGVAYEVRVARTRALALRDAAATIARTGRPVVLLAWRGAHNWVMTGFRATADPLVFADARVTGAYIVDPWYPRVSSIWGRSDPPGAFQDAAEMRRNYLQWKRPDGRYPTRDGRFVYLAPAEPS